MYQRNDNWKIVGNNLNVFPKFPGQGGGETLNILLYLMLKR